MIWDDVAFKEAYRARLRQAQTSSDVEVRAQSQAFQAEAARAGGSSPEHFLQRAGAAAAATLSGYVREALEGFDGMIASLEAELEDADLQTLREGLEQEIARRSKALPAALRDFSRPAAHPAVLRNILRQAPVNARQLLAERVAAFRDRIRTRARAQELLDHAIFIGHDAGGAAVAGALKLAILDAAGADAPVYTSSEIEDLRERGDGCERVLAQLKKNRMSLTIVRAASSGNPWLWWAAGVAAGLGKPAFVLRAHGMGADPTLPISPAQDIDLTRREDVERLLQAIQGELRRRPKDPSELDLENLLKTSAPTGDGSTRVRPVASGSTPAAEAEPA